MVIIVAWCTPEEVRKEIGMLAEDVPDQDLEYYISRAHNRLLEDIAVSHRDENLIGDINGVNTTFTTSVGYIADSNFDNTINISDVTINTWGDRATIDTRTNVTASTLYPEFGIVVLTSAPANTVECVAMDYWTYPKEINTGKLSQVTALLAAYYYIGAEHLLMPQKWMHGAYRFEKGTPEEILERRYERALLGLKGRAHKKVKHDKITFLRGEE